jgi:hypothetical protein
LAFLFSVSIAFCFSSTARAQYSDNLSEIYRPPAIDLYFHPPTPIGDLGRIQTVIDLRGFIPMSLPKRKDNIADKIINFNGHDDSWYKIPTKKALLILYYGTLPFDRVADDTSNLEGAFHDTRFLSESAAEREFGKWIELSYGMTKVAPQMWDLLIGGSGFEGAEPVTLFLTENSVFEILSIRYSDSSTVNGQLLIALEFSRSSRRYKALYKLSSTTLLNNKPTREAFISSAPFIEKAIIAAF